MTAAIKSIHTTDRALQLRKYTYGVFGIGATFCVACRICGEAIHGCAMVNERRQQLAHKPATTFLHGCPANVQHELISIKADRQFDARYWIC
jgi:hypothetical protein